MSNNRTFFKNVKEGNMSLGDIFSDVTRKHTPQETAGVLTAGTALTTPRESEMLAGWQKPFLFARFFLGFVAVLVLSYVMGTLLGHDGGVYLLLVGIPFLVPVTLLLLVWEMNVPRNISLYEIIKIVALGGIMSLIATIIISYYSDLPLAAWAGVVEEPAKLVIIYAILHKKNYKYAINGVLIGAAVGTGFAVMESLYYVFNNIFIGIVNALIVCANEGLTAVDIVNNSPMVWSTGIMNGLDVALARAVTAISGHGVFAALYGGALVKAKGDEEISLTHLFKLEFLAYFVVSILLHALHNYGINLGLPVLLDGLLPCEYIIIAAIAVALLLNSLKMGVNQVVGICAAKNGGRVTMAVNRGAAPAQASAPASNFEVQIQCVAGPSVGQSFRCRDGQSLTLGRGSRCDIALSGCDSVSGTHCRIAVSGGRVTITDLNSTNGTYLDNQRLAPSQPMPALDNSTIYLGNKNVAFRIHFR